mgnify:CR=1 FL=1
MKFVHLALIGLVSAARLHQSDVGLAKRAEHANANAKFNSGALVQVTNSDDAAASTDAEEAENGKSATMNKGQQGNAKKNENGTQHTLAQKESEAEEEKEVDEDVASAGSEVKGNSANRNKGQQGAAMKALHANANASHKRED